MTMYRSTRPATATVEAMRPCDWLSTSVGRLSVLISSWNVPMAKLVAWLQTQTRVDDVVRLDLVQPEASQAWVLVLKKTHWTVSASNDDQ